mmetsp:Transcript_7311/g.21317  ORF Transcript_7311/g.21317 Transcript_7311/m.21317 type:complete len:215 (-) Transcript_7311:513-1157(-)
MSFRMHSSLSCPQVSCMSWRHSQSQASASSEDGSVQSSSERLRGEVSGLSRRLSAAAASATSAFSTSSSSSDPLTCSAPQSTEEEHKKVLSRTAPVAGSMSFSVALRSLIMIARLGSRVWKTTIVSVILVTRATPKVALTRPMVRVPRVMAAAMRDVALPVRVMETARDLTCWSLSISMPIAASRFSLTMASRVPTMLPFICMAGKFGPVSSLS